MPAPNVVVAQRTFTEATGAGVYSASVKVPANAVLRFIRYNNRVAWTATTSATLVIGTAAAGDQLLTATNLKTAISIHEVADADLDAIQPTPTTARMIYVTVTTVGAAGSAGRGVLEVGYERLPDATLSDIDPLAATKV